MTGKNGWPEWKGKKGIDGEMRMLPKGNGWIMPKYWPELKQLWNLNIYIYK